MRYIRKIPKGRGLNEPILHGDHRRPVSRRDFLSAGLVTGAATVIVPTAASLLAARAARADVLDATWSASARQLRPRRRCGQDSVHRFDLSGGANIAGSNVLIGKQGGQLDFLSTAGYSKLGLPGNMTPESADLHRHARSALPSIRTAHSCAACSMRAAAGTASEHQRHHHCRALRERHRQQSAQSDVRHCPHRREGRTADAHRLGELGFRRQLDGPHRDDGSDKSVPPRWIAPATSRASSTPANWARCSRIRPMRLR